MKKVFLSLAAVAVLTVVSCKKTDAPAEETMAADTTTVAVDSMAVDTVALAVDSMAVETPAAE
jgi:PBP1b-binding outer membrane lipoprotein LpoB